MNICFSDLGKASVDGYGFARLDISDNIDPVSRKQSIVGQFGVENWQFHAHLAVFKITDVHDYPISTPVTNGNKKETIRYSIKIPHGEIHTAVFIPRGVISTVLVAPGRADAIVLNRRIGFYFQRTTGNDLVRTRRKINVVGSYGYIS